MKNYYQNDNHLQIIYQIKLYKRGVFFLWGATLQSPLKSSIDLKANLNPDEILKIAKKYETQIKNKTILIQNLDTYNRLLIYACVRPHIKNGLQHKLEETIQGMTSWDAHYWAASFRESWWKHGNSDMLTNKIEAFKLFFEIG